MFGEVVTKNFGADVAKRIQQRKEMLTTGQVEGKKLTRQQKQQVAAAQQREMQGLYQRGAATGKEGGFNEMLRESIVKAMETGMANAKEKELEETNAKETGKDKPAAEGGGKPKEEGEGGVEVKAKTEGKFTHNVNVTGKIDTDALTASIGEAIEKAVQDAFDNLGEDGKRAYKQAKSKKAAKTKPNTSYPGVNWSVPG
jgi:hypothetical protein